MNAVSSRLLRFGLRQSSAAFPSPTDVRKKRQRTAALHKPAGATSSNDWNFSPGLLRVHSRPFAVALFFAVLAARAGTVAPVWTDPVQVRLETNSADAAWRDGTLVVTNATGSRWPGATLQPVTGHWDFSASQRIVAHIRNTGPEAMKFYLRADDAKTWTTGEVFLRPGAGGDAVVTLNHGPWRKPAGVKLDGMRGTLDGGKIDAARVTRLMLFAMDPKRPASFDVTSIQAEGAVQTLNVTSFFPFVDRFGQFLHGDWPGKTHDEAELKQARADEDADFDTHPGPADRNAFGGWKSGPRREATGFFRVEKIDGRWWFVDPEGCLFWSHGVDSVRSDNGGPLTHREHYFAELPPANCRESGTSHIGFYADKGRYETVDFTRWNLMRKYGEDWRALSAARAHTRLRSWGLNTIGNWSGNEMLAIRGRTPYVATLGTRSARKIEGSEGYWTKFPDPFDVSFTNAVREACEAQRGKAAGDPWCLGFFVDNELSWDSEYSLAEGALASPSDQPARQAFVAALQSKYAAVSNLNAAWARSFADWNAVRGSGTNRNDAMKADLRGFTRTIAGTYFRTIRDGVREVAPKQLYLGCRFAWVNDEVAAVAARYCDVVSFNRYERSVEKLKLPGGADVPMIIGEFHFGALDRGMFHTGLQSTRTQDERAARYEAYVLSALRHPQIVGTHWFEYRDEPLTGRFDGENYQIGFVDGCDRPYPELVAVARKIGATMYRERQVAAGAGL